MIENRSKAVAFDYTDFIVNICSIATDLLCLVN